jgi:hypothetical protein
MLRKSATGGRAMQMLLPPKILPQYNVNLTPSRFQGFFMSHKHLAFFLLAGLLGAGAQAQVAVTADLGTTGVGAHLVLPIQPQLNGRVGLNYFNYDVDHSAGSVDYNARAKLKTFDLLLDWYPSATGIFRLTAGALYNGTRADVTGRPNAAGTFTINGTQYSAGDVGRLEGKADFRKAAPYIGIGWGNALAKESGWSFGADVGAFFQGSARVRLNSVGCQASSAICSQLARDVAVEQANLEDDADSFKVYPVLRAAVSYRF